MWSDAAQYLVDGKGAMHIMGDWTDGWFTSKGYNGVRLADRPGTKIFDGCPTVSRCPRAPRTRPTR